VFVILLTGVIMLLEKAIAELIGYPSLLLQKTDFGAPYIDTFTSFIPQVVVYIFGIFMLRKWAFKRSFSEAGFSFQGFLPAIFRGLSYGFALIFVGYIIILSFGGLTLSDARLFGSNHLRLFWQKLGYFPELNRFCAHALR
jgi:hypothetical protein